MNSIIPEDGGPAFPCKEADNQGMSLRDWLAGQALAGFTREQGGKTFNEQTTRWYARVAYDLANAMLLVRNQQKTNPKQEQKPVQTPTPWNVQKGMH